MKIVVDGLPKEVPDGATLVVVLHLLGEAAEHALIEVNGAYVHPGEFEILILKPGDRLEVIYPAFGG